MTPPRMSAENRRESILAAAVPLFAKHGFNGTTTKMIAQAADISEALMYRHFSSKEAIYDELKTYCNRDKQLLAEKIGHMEPSTSTLVHIISYLVHHIVMGDPHEEAQGIRHRDMHRLLVNSYLEDGDFARRFIEENIRVWETTLRACVDAAIEAGDLIRDWINTANRWWFIHHLAVGMGLLRLPADPVIPYEVDTTQRLDEAVRFSLRGMGMTDAAIRTYYNPAVLALFEGGLRSTEDDPQGNG